MTMYPVAVRVFSVGAIVVCLHGPGWAGGSEGLLFHAAFDGSADAAFAVGQSTPVAARGIAFVPGLAGGTV